MFFPERQRRHLKRLHLYVLDLHSSLTRVPFRARLPCVDRGVRVAARRVQLEIALA